ncbi:hypothetical protein VNO77_23198 [Canavalia gladiata]|uniref:Uncharacterized protein n=1 Tax=Canavalia gladiata TaxID=3824 RepID=A0AAN9L7C6_CANGL
MQGGFFGRTGDSFVGLGKNFSNLVLKFSGKLGLGFDPLLWGARILLWEEGRRSKKISSGQINPLELNRVLRGRICMEIRSVVEPLEHKSLYLGGLVIPESEKGDSCQLNRIPAWSAYMFSV